MTYMHPIAVKNVCTIQFFMDQKDTFIIDVNSTEDHVVLLWVVDAVV